MGYDFPHVAVDGVIISMSYRILANRNKVKLEQLVSSLRDEEFPSPPLGPLVGPEV